MNNFKKALISFLALFGIVAVAGCKDEGTTTTTNTTTVAPTTTEAPTTTTTTTEFDKDAGYRDITSSLTLSVPYEGKNFIDDGIGLATVSRYTDGDTTQFRLETKSSTASTSYVVLRYHGVDTPESTAGVEKWGKTAALYTENRLKSAYEIVLEGNTAPASTESNGRYLGYVWYRESATDTFKNLNLELVENGYSMSTSPVAKYQPYFLLASQFAQEHEMHIWGDDEDPNFSEEPMETTLKDIVDDLASDEPTMFNVETQVGARVKFEAFISEKSTSSNGAYYYVISEFDNTGKKYSMNLFGGYSSSVVNTILNVGYKVCFVGTIQKYSGAYQISGLEYVVGGDINQNTHVVQADYYQYFDNDNSRLSLKQETAINGDLVVKSVTRVDNTLVIVGEAYDYYKTANNNTKKDFTFKVEITENDDISKIIEGASIKAEGFTNEDGSIQVLYKNLIVR